ncbi:MAG: acyltransferase [Chloroflexi bacterium HGW-Chloroflexi-10]|nr:MAG: acyltransferase [Chloroflexi bacterium HGW-Chloroflexi-10]
MIPIRKLFWCIHYLKVFFADSTYSYLVRLWLMVLGATIGKKFRANGSISLIVHPTARIKIGTNVRINSGHLRNMVGGFRRTGIHVGKNARLEIGNNVGISNSTIVCMSSIVLENDVYIGGDCAIYDTDFHPIDPLERKNNRVDMVNMRPIKFKSGVFLGAHSIVLKGVTIGENSVIGAGSVVSRNIPDNEIWAGNPIKKIGQREVGTI